MEPYNFTYLFNNTVCEQGMGCLFRNVNTVGNGYPFLTIMAIVLTLSMFGMITVGNSVRKSLLVVSFVGLLMVSISVPYQLINEIWLFGLIITFAGTAGLSAWSMKNN